MSYEPENATEARSGRGEDVKPISSLVFSFSRFPVFWLVAHRSLLFQNKKYRCAIGRISAGSQVNSMPSARTSYVSGLTSILGR